METQRATAALALFRPAPEWVQLMPLGVVQTRPHDARQPWRLTDAQAVVAASRALGQDLVIDYEHQTARTKQNGQPAPAAGWVTELAIRQDGIYGRVAWTAKARELINEGAYRFLSPVFSYDKATREVARIEMAALTNDPALVMRGLDDPEGDDENSYVAAARRLPGASHALPGISPAELDVCNRLGISPERFKRVRDGS